MKTTTTHTIETYKGALEVEIDCIVWLGLPSTNQHPGDDPEVTIERMTIDDTEITGPLMAAIVERIGVESIEDSAIAEAKTGLAALKAESRLTWGKRGRR